MTPTDAGRIVVVTGANEGIGYHLLDALRADGDRVAGLDVDDRQLGALADAHPETVAAIDCDVTDDAAVTAAVDTVLDRWGRIDVLVNNAGIFRLATMADRTLADTRAEFEVNYFGALRMLHAVLPHMRERGSGIVHTVSSGVGRTGHPGLSGYAATKAALEATVRSLRYELRDTGVACTVMHPPLVRTRSGEQLGYATRFMQSPEAVGRKLASKIDATRPVIYADWSTRIGLAVATSLPGLVGLGIRGAWAPPEQPVATDRPGSVGTGRKEPDETDREEADETDREEADETAREEADETDRGDRRD